MYIHAGPRLGEPRPTPTTAPSRFEQIFRRPPPTGGPAPSAATPIPTLAQAVERSLRVLQSQPLDPEPTRRLRCMVPLVLNRAIDDRYINGFDYVTRTVTRLLTPEQLNLLMSRVRADLTSQWFGPAQPDSTVRESLRLLDARIHRGISLMNERMHVEGAAMSRASVQIKDWMAAQQRNPNSVYSCYGGVRDRR